MIRSPPPPEDDTEWRKPGPVNCFPNRVFRVMSESLLHPDPPASKPIEPPATGRTGRIPAAVATPGAGPGTASQIANSDTRDSDESCRADEPFKSPAQSHSPAHPVNEEQTGPSWREITAGIRQGQTGSFEVLYDHYFDSIYRHVRHLTGRDEATCLDILQETMLKIIRAIKPMESQAGLSAWIRVVTKTVTYDWLRKETRRTRRLASRGTEPDPGDHNPRFLAGTGPGDLAGETTFDAPA